MKTQEIKNMTDDEKKVYRAERILSSFFDDDDDFDRDTAITRSKKKFKPDASLSYKDFYVSKSKVSAHR